MINNEFEEKKFMNYCKSCGAEIEDQITFCPSCGAEIGTEEKIQMTEQEVSGEEKVQMAKPDHDQFQQPQQELPQLVQRNYIIWFLLNAIIPIFYLVYFYFVFDDLNKLDQHPKPAGVKSTFLEQNSLIIFIVLSLLGLGLIANYLMYSKKYGMFNDYLDTHPQKQTKLPSKNFIKLMIFRDVLLYSGLGLSFGGAFMFGFSPFSDGGFFAFHYSIIPNVDLGLLATIGMDPTFYIAIILIILGSLFLIGSSVISIYMIVLDFRWQEAMNERVAIIDKNFIKKDFL